jgi:AraC-like DNA-binding protein
VRHPRSRGNRRAAGGEKAGFRHAEYLNVAFKRQTGMTPRAYRLQIKRPG